MLPGREREGAYLNELITRVREGHSAAIMVHGVITQVGPPDALSDEVSAAYLGVTA